MLKPCDILLGIELENSSEGKYCALVITPVPCELGVRPTSVESGLLHRIFSKYAKEGNPAVGQSWLVCIADQSGMRMPRVVAAISLTATNRQSGVLKGRRLMVWPACDISQTTKWSNGVEINLNHISFESSEERISTHITGAGGTSDKQRESNGGMRKVGNDYVLGRIFIKDFAFLDRLIETKVDLNQRFSREKLEHDLQQLEESVTMHMHPLLPVPTGPLWGEGAFVSVELRLSDNDADEEWPIFIPREHVVGGDELHGKEISRKYRIIEINPGLFLKVGVSLIPADLDVPLMWVNEDSELRRAYSGPVEKTKLGSNSSPEEGAKCGNSVNADL